MICQLDGACEEINDDCWPPVGVPTYYQWGVYYRKDIFEQMGIAVPANWADFIAACAKLKAGGVTQLPLARSIWIRPAFSVI